MCIVHGSAQAAETPSSSAVGLGLTIGGAATTTLSGIVLLAAYGCHPDSDGSGCPGHADRRAGAIGLVAGVIMLAVGSPLYVFSSQSERAVGGQQLGAQLQSFTMKLSF